MGTMSTRRHNCTTTILHIWNNNKQAFLSAIVAGMIIHFSIYGYGLMNPDAIWLGEKYIADWEVAVGRWGLKFFDYLHGGVNAPVIITMIALFWFSVGGILINEIFEVNSRAVRVIVPLLLCGCLCRKFLFGGSGSVVTNFEKQNQNCHRPCYTLCYMLT